MPLTMPIEKKLVYKAGAKTLIRAQNKSGSGVVNGDVVVLDTTNSGATNVCFTTTTSQDDLTVLGMAIQTIANGEYGEIQTDGPTDALKVDGTTDIAKGDEISTFTTAKIGAKATAGKGGAFATALEAYTANDSSGVIDAWLHAPARIDASLAGNTLDASYDQGGAGAGRSITVNDGAVALTKSDAGTENVLEVSASPSAGAAGAAIKVINGANSTGASIDIANAGSGNDIEGTSDTWTVSKVGAALFATVDVNGGADAIILDADGDTTISADVDDQINFEVNSTDVVTMTASTVTVSANLVADELILDTDGVAPAGSNAYLVSDNSGDVTVNVVTAKDFIVAVNGTDEYSFSSSQAKLNANELCLDADDNTSITADTDDQIDIKIGGADDFTFTANSFNVLTGSDLNIADDEHLQLGTNDDIVLLNRSTSLNADTTLANVVEGAPKTLATAANSLIISNITDDGDIHLIASKAGNSFTAFLADGSTGDTIVNAATGQSVDVYIDGTKEIDYATGAMAFQQATTISTTATTLTLSPATDVVIPDAKGLITGSSTQITISDGGGATNLVPEIQAIGVGASFAGGAIIAATCNTTNDRTVSPKIALVKGGAATQVATTAVADNEVTGSIISYASDGTDFETPVGAIEFVVDDVGGPAGGQIGGSIEFYTTADGGETLTKALTIDNAQGLVGAKLTGNMDANSQSITGLTSITLQDSGTVGHIDNTDSAIYLMGSNNVANGNGAIVQVNGKTKAGDPGQLILYTPNAAGGANVARLTMTMADVATATWASAIVTGDRRSVENHTADDVLTAAESGSIHTNYGDGGVQTLTLPVGVAGLEFEFKVAAAFEMRIEVGAAAETLIANGAVNIDDGGADLYISADDEGESITVTCISAGVWLVSNVVGTWTVTQL